MNSATTSKTTLQMMKRKDWIEMRTVQLAETLWPDSQLIMTIYSGIFLGLAPWLSMLLLYLYGQLLSVLTSGQLGLISFGMAVWLLVAATEFIASKVTNFKSQLVGRIIQMVGRHWIENGAEAVTQRTGHPPLKFEQLCQCAASVEYQLYSLYARISTLRLQNPLMYLVVVLALFTAHLVVSLFISDRQLAYLILTGPLFLPALHHYHLLSRTYHAVQPYYEQQVHSRGFIKFVEPVITPLSQLFQRLAKQYQDAAAIPEEFWQSQTPESKRKLSNGNMFRKSSSMDTMEDLLQSSSKDKNQKSTSLGMLTNLMSPGRWLDSFLQNPSSPAAQQKSSSTPTKQHSSSSIDSNKFHTVRLADMKAGAGNNVNMPGSGDRNVKQRKRSDTKPQSKQSQRDALSQSLDDFDVIDSADAFVDKKFS